MRAWVFNPLSDGTRITPELLKEDMLKPGAVMLKGVDNQNNLIGCVYTAVENDKMYVGMFCVKPDLQAAGLGKMLMSAVDNLAKEKGCSASRMEVISRRTELIEYYKRRGYRDTGMTAPFPTGEAHGKPKVPLEFIVLQKDY